MFFARAVLGPSVLRNLLKTHTAFPVRRPPGAKEDQSSDCAAILRNLLEMHQSFSVNRPSDAKELRSKALLYGLVIAAKEKCLWIYN